LPVDVTVINKCHRYKKVGRTTSPCSATYVSRLCFTIDYT